MRHNTNFNTSVYHLPITCGQIKESDTAGEK